MVRGLIQPPWLLSMALARILSFQHQRQPFVFALLPLDCLRPTTNTHTAMANFYLPNPEAMPHPFRKKKKICCLCTSGQLGDMYMKYFKKRAGDSFGYGKVLTSEMLQFSLFCQHYITDNLHNGSECERNLGTFAFVCMQLK